MELMTLNLKQGLVIIKTAWMRNLNYRFTVIMYRVGEIAEILALILMWTTIYATGAGTIKGFTLNEMITYVLFGNFCGVIVRNFLPAYISRDINEGRLSMFLVKPIHYIRFIFFNELGRAALAFVVSVSSQLLVILFFLNKFVLNAEPAYLALIVVMIILAFLTEWLIGFLIGSIAFWTDEVDGIQTTVDRVKRFFSGGYFPLSLLPLPLAVASTYLPFAYSFFMPAQLYLKKIDLHAGLMGIGIQILWVIILSVILNVVWKQGLKRYEASGS
ncbi:MAG TPA: ABC-2 family transporter protein [Candidatus Paceibacterota bacterium]|nr:ABC-2 family transporter protein [Candidatus Paceibacterota bacterium]